MSSTTTTTTNTTTNTNTTTESSSSSSSTCPYATLPRQDDWQQCPVFAQGTCPFKDAKDAQQIKRTLQQMPVSHLQNNSFLQLLQDMHQRNASELSVPGGCPIARPVTGVSFREALEQMSLAAIMANLMESAEDDEETLEEHEENTRIIDASVIVETPTNTTTPQQQQQQQKQQQQHSLSESLKTGTARSHQAAENVHFVKNFIQGKIDRDLYASMVGMLYHVYVALEQCLDQYAPQQFASCHFPHQLRRTETLKQDVDFWWGAKVPPLTPATQDYINRLYHVAQTDPLLLLAHAYTRYLGDLSGGKVLARVARRALSLSKSNDGLEFYHFEHIPSMKLFKDHYRQALDALLLTEEQIQRIVAEANVAFCLNMRLFEELDVQANVPGATVRPLEDALAYASQAAVPEVAASDECPFLKTKSKSDNSTMTTKRCPWPFVFAHDPAQGMKDWQTWMVLGLVLCWMWNMIQSKVLE
ncbi:heme oxygenase 1 [Fistulifera solaris]|uniref:Heme oxygenase 1 n=1 Tax=Fistulifera solaris TaxID=1519565 RepID=A0A1Z5KKG4_FISSO|nr:heme oxygenase 1 [Fistulifera solaris]|eukprot:GAX26814.1 heme oxygenase 1 [Fistulifera solaris]